VCRKCNDVIDADADVLHRLDNELDELYGFDPDLDHFSIFGVCSECQVQ
jgi:Fur family ferric uptake transcriptional regulator